MNPFFSPQFYVLLIAGVLCVCSGCDSGQNPGDQDADSRSDVDLEDSDLGDSDLDDSDPDDSDPDDADRDDPDPDSDRETEADADEDSSEDGDVDADPDDDESDADQIEDGDDADLIECPDGEQLCGEICVDTTTDPEHCGGCDQLCEAPDGEGTVWCGGETCFHTIVFHELDGYDTSLAQDTDDLYWLDSDVGVSGSWRILTSPKSSSSPEIILSDRDHIRAFLVYGSNVYWLENSRIYRMRTSGGEITTLSTRDGRRSFLDTDGRELFFFEDSGGVFSLSEVPISGGDSTSLAELSGNPRALAVDGTNLYWTDENGSELWQMAKTGVVPTLLSDTISTVFSLAVDDTTIYWASYLASGSIDSMPIGGGDITNLSDAHGNPTDLAILDGVLYWVGYTAGLYQLDLDLGSEFPMAGGYSSALEVDDEAVFWVIASWGDGHGEIRKTVEIPTI